MRTLRFIGPIAALLLAGGIAAGSGQTTEESLVARFLRKEVRTPVSYRARRHLEAANPRFNKSAWLDVVTLFDTRQMRFTIVRRGGSELVQNKVLIAALEGEQELLREGRDPIALSTANYRFEEAGLDASGVPRIRLVPLRRDKKLLDGHLLVTPDGDLLEVSGRLSKAPSFWTTSVQLTRRYGRANGIRVPVSVTSVANIRIAGRSTFSMTYDFEMIDGEAVQKAR